nr:hypothetical protein [Diaphorobacter aerolatus]
MKRAPELHDGLVDPILLDQSGEIGRCQRDENPQQRDDAEKFDKRESDEVNAPRGGVALEEACRRFVVTDMEWSSKPENFLVPARSSRWIDLVGTGPKGTAMKNKVRSGSPLSLRVFPEVVINPG